MKDPTFEKDFRNRSPPSAHAPFFAAQLEPLNPKKRYLHSPGAPPRPRKRLTSIGRAPGLVPDCRIRGFLQLGPRPRLDLIRHCTDLTFGAHECCCRPREESRPAKVPAEEALGAPDLVPDRQIGGFFDCSLTPQPCSQEFRSRKTNRYCHQARLEGD